MFLLMVSVLLCLGILLIRFSQNLIRSCVLRFLKLILDVLLSLFIVSIFIVRVTLVSSFMNRMNGVTLLFVIFNLNLKIVSNFRTYYTARSIVSVVGRVYGPSRTRPDQTLTLGQLIDRFVRKQAIPTVPLVNVDVDVSKFDHLNKFERIDAARDLAKRAETLQSNLDASKAAISKKKAKAKFDADVAAAVSTKLIENAEKQK